MSRVTALLGRRSVSVVPSPVASCAARIKTRKPAASMKETLSRSSTTGRPRSRTESMRDSSRGADAMSISPQTGMSSVGSSPEPVTIGTASSGPSVPGGTDGKREGDPGRLCPLLRSSVELAQS